MTQGSRPSGDGLNLQVVGISHSSAPVHVLEQATLTEDGIQALIARINESDQFSAAYALSTCNRTEVYVEVSSTADDVTTLRDFLSGGAALASDEIRPYLYQHSGENAVRHLFAVASGLDSVVLGEDQILGQVKGSLERSQQMQSLGPMINQLVQDAIRVGKRTRSETDLNRAGRSLATVGLSELATITGTLAGMRALVVGAGSMGGVVVAALRGLELSAIDVANRTPDKAARLAASAGGRGHRLDELPQLLTETDVVVTCTGGTGVLITAANAAEAVRRRSGRPLYILDLALPRNVDADVADLDGVSMVDLNTITGLKRDLSAVASVEQSRRIIDSEAAAFVASRRAARVAPALSAMRSLASTAVESELDRLLRKVPALDDHAQSEIAQSVQRIVDKVLHGPTVRARELAGLPDGALYVEVMGRLFDHTSRQLDPEVLA